MDKNIFYIFLISVFGSLGMFFRQSLFGFDSYATALCVKTGECVSLINQDLAVVVFGLLPDNLFVFKFVMFFSLFLSLVVLYFLAREFVDKKKALFALVVLLGFVPAVIFEFAKFENELFAYPLIFLSVLFFVREKYLFSLFFLCFGGLFWQGSVYLLFVFGLVNPFFFVGLILVLFFMFSLFFGFLVPTGVLESLFLSGFYYLFFGVLFIPGFFLLKCKKLWIIFVVLLLLVGLQGKLIILLVPFVLIGIVQTFKLLDKKGIDVKNVVLVALFFIIGLNIAIFMQQPSDSDWFLIEHTINLSKDTNFSIYNDWSYGHWLQYKNYSTVFKSGGYDPDYNNLEKPFIALTQQVLDCDQDYNFITFTKTVYVWKCYLKK